MSSQEIKRLIVRYFGPMLKNTQRSTISYTQIIVLENKNKSSSKNKTYNREQSITHVESVAQRK